MPGPDITTGALEHPRNAELALADARRRAAAIEREFGEPTLDLILIGAIGAGKSAAVNALADLNDSAPASRADLTALGALPVGAGRTTVCEVVLQAGRPEGYAITLTPAEEAEVRASFRQVAGELWDRNHETFDPADPPDPSAAELRRVVLNMAGLSGRGRPGPADHEAAAAASPEELTERLLARAALAARVRTSWSPRTLRDLRSQLGRLNAGQDPEASLPERLDVTLPRALIEGGPEGVAIRVVDTRGLDGPLGARADLVEHLRSPRAIPILCSTFLDAPNAATRGALEAMAADATLRPALERTLILLLDHGDAEQVPDADGDREVGRQIRREECWRALRGAGLDSGLSEDDVIPFDALADDPGALRRSLGEKVRATWDRRQRDLMQAREDAARDLDEADAQLSSDIEAIDERLIGAMRATPLEAAPLLDPLRVVTAAIEACPYARRIQATVHRAGRFRNLNLFQRVRSAAAAAATAWTDPLLRSLRAELDTMEADPRVPAWVVRERRAALEQGNRAFVQTYADAVAGEMERLASPDAPVWQAARDAWAQGAGYRARVVASFERWGALQPFNAHRGPDPARHLPLLARAAAPGGAPTITVVATWLRALHHLRWTPTGAALLVGANGSGKSTALGLLRFFPLAWERGVPTALTLAFGGPDVRSWDAPDDAPVTLALTAGDVTWELTIHPSGVVRERVLDDGEEVLSQDELGQLVWRGSPLVASPGASTGLRAALAAAPSDLALRALARAATSIRVTRVTDVHTVKERGSDAQDDQDLQARGANVLSVLRRWRQELAGQERYAFVMDGARAAFPELFDDLEFAQAGNVLAASVVHPTSERPGPLSAEADGVVQALIVLCAVAGAPDGALVALDEPDNHLHPYAARALLRHVEDRVWERDLTVVFATHSTVLLDAVEPERVFVMKAQNGRVPTAVSDLYDAAWLRGFTLGALYADDNLGSNVDRD
ncbi:MAG TPA: ATP-binding protein [Myxococcota bacterium]|nr:ATP-binding protein [Myxococcota bacterium]